MLLVWLKKASSSAYVHACYACVYNLVFAPPQKRVWDGAGVCSSNRQVSGGTAAAKVKAKVAATSRPHTLRIQLSSHHQHNSNMASDESIGSCSLDADVTASDASGTFWWQHHMLQELIMK